MCVLEPTIVLCATMNGCDCYVRGVCMSVVRSGGKGTRVCMEENVDMYIFSRTFVYIFDRPNSHNCRGI